METELFGPVMTIFVYEDAKWEETLELVDLLQYALTGAVFSQDRYAIEVATVKYKMLPVTSISMTNQQVLLWDNNHLVEQELQEQMTKQVLH
jgi:hypothetical protein